MVISLTCLQNLHEMSSFIIEDNIFYINDATSRLTSEKQTLDDAYAAPANFLEIDVINPITHGVGAKRYTDYEVRMKVQLINFGSKFLGILSTQSNALTSLPLLKI